MKILIVEDFRALAKALQETLQSLGHQVQTVVGFSDLETLQAVDMDGNAVTLAGADFQFALVDGQIEQFNGKPDSPITGPDVVAHLVKLGVTCFGMSTENEHNSTMVANGAVNAANKAIVFAAFVGGVMTAENAIACDQVAALRFSELRSSFMSADNKPLRSQCDELVKKHF